MKRLLVMALLAGCGGDDGGSTPVDGSMMDSAPMDTTVPGKRVFVTSMNTNADLRSIGGAATGILSADVICNNMAGAVGVTGTWQAWISDSTTDAIDRITGTGPWFRMDGQMAFLNKANLTTQPLVPITVTEKGTTVMFPPDLINAWTGTAAGGRFQPSTGATCSDWSAITGEGTVGDAGEVDSGWTNFAELDCDLMGRLYCFEK
ncbi:MAG: hypothetical protein AB7T06_26740 [Kofleriaceae bacterium]